MAQLADHQRAALLSAARPVPAEGGPPAGWVRQLDRRGQAERGLLYWSRRDGVYYVVRQRAAEGGFDQVGRFCALDAAVALATALAPDAGG